MTDIKDLYLPVLTSVTIPFGGYLLMGTMPMMVFLLAWGGGLALYIATL